MIQEALATLSEGGRLSEAASERVFEDLLSGALDAAQIGALLALMRPSVIGVPELVGAARAMRRHVTPVPVPSEWLGSLVDTCGTGGAPKTFNISTAAAIVAAAAGGMVAKDEASRVRVAKHGNRSRTGRGSAEVLSELGVNVDASPEAQVRCLEKAGVCFCFAIHHHPAVRHAGPARRAVGFNTIFNLLGPLTNPAGARRQVIGVYAPELVALMSGALAALGAERAMVVHGAEGLDEMSLVGMSRVGEVGGGRSWSDDIEAAGLGVTPRLASAGAADLAVRDVAESAAMVRRVVSGEAGAGGLGVVGARDIVLLNAAAALVVGGGCQALAQGVELGRRAIDSGAAARTLAMLIEESKRVA